MLSKMTELKVIPYETPRRKYVRQVDWLDHRDFILEKLKSGCSHSEIIRSMATERQTIINSGQLKRLLKAWGATTRNLTTKQKKYIRWAYKQRLAAGKEKHAFAHLDTGEEIEPEKLQKVLDMSTISSRGSNICYSPAGIWAFTPYGSATVRSLKRMRADITMEGSTSGSQEPEGDENSESSLTGASMTEDETITPNTEVEEMITVNPIIDPDNLEDFENFWDDEDMTDFAGICDKILEEITQSNIPLVEQPPTPREPFPTSNPLAPVLGHPDFLDNPSISSFINNWKDCAMFMITEVYVGSRNFGKSSEESIREAWTRQITQHEPPFPHDVYLSMLIDKNIEQIHHGNVPEPLSMDRDTKEILSHYSFHAYNLLFVQQSADLQIVVNLPDVIKAYGLYHVFSAFLLAIYGKFIWRGVSPAAAVLPLRLAVDVYNRIGMGGHNRAAECQRCLLRTIAGRVYSI